MESDYRHLNPWVKCLRMLILTMLHVASATHEEEVFLLGQVLRALYGEVTCVIPSEESLSNTSVDLNVLLRPFFVSKPFNSLPLTNYGISCIRTPVFPVLKSSVIVFCHDDNALPPTFTLHNASSNLLNLVILRCNDKPGKPKQFHELFFRAEDFKADLEKTNITKPRLFHESLERLFLLTDYAESFSHTFLCRFPKLKVLYVHESVSKTIFRDACAKTHICCKSLKSLFLSGSVDELSLNTIPRLRTSVINTGIHDLSGPMEDFHKTIELEKMLLLIEMLMAGIDDMLNKLSYTNFMFHPLFIQVLLHIISQMFYFPKPFEVKRSEYMPRFQKYANAQFLTYPYENRTDFCTGSCMKMFHMRTMKTESITSNVLKQQTIFDTPLNLTNILTEFKTDVLTIDMQQILLNDTIPCQSLKMLFLRGNHLSFIAHNALQNCKQLLTLDIHYNELSSLHYVNTSTGERSNVFNSSHLLVIEYIKISNNKITRIDYSEIPLSVIHLDVSFNPIEIVSDEKHVVSRISLKVISLTHVPLKSLNEVTFPPSIEIIDLSYSKLRYIPSRYFQNLVNLKQFRADNTNLFLSFGTSTYRVTPIINFSALPVQQTHESDLAARNCVVGEWTQKMKPKSKAKEIVSDDTYAIVDCSNRNLTNVQFNRRTIRATASFLDGNNLKTVNLKDLFEKLEVLYMYLNNSKVQIVHGRVNHSVPLLELHLEDNEIQFLNEGIFSNFNSLQGLYLQRNKLSRIENVFSPNSIPVDFHAENNQLTQFPPFFPDWFIHDGINFANSPYEVHLECNSIRELNSSKASESFSFLFLTLQRASFKLFLQNNSLVEIAEKKFSDFPSLVELHLQHNNIRVIRNAAFKGLIGLLKLHLEHNEINDMHPNSLSHLLMLQELYLNHNQLTHLQTALFRVLKNLQLLNLNNNQIHTIHESFIESLGTLQYLHLSNNRLTQLTFTVIRDQFQSLIHLCLSNNSLRLLQGIQTTFPYLEELYLDSNELSSVEKYDFENLRKLKSLHLHQNHLSEIQTNSFATLLSLTTLTLDNNSLVQPQPWDYGLLSPLTNITLFGNIFVCECDYISQFVEWRRGNKWVSNSTECLMPGDEWNVNAQRRKLESFLREDCMPVIRILIIVLPIVGAVTILGLVVFFVYRYRLEMQVILYSRYGVRFFYDPKQDEGKAFDVFIAYSGADEAFVADDLFPGLSDFRVCVHGRDFPVGAPIADTIVRATEASCCTLIVLSPSFIRSEWCRFEFQMAHCRALTERCRRLIVLIYQDVDMDQINGEISAYLRTNTYLRWDDKLFWKKLLFALPNPKDNLLSSDFMLPHNQLKS